jgi:hypothetical protein
VSASRTVIYWRQAVQFTVGNPVVAKVSVFGGVHEAMRPFLPPAAQVR